MNFRILKIRINQLPDFIQSREYSEYEYVPISPSRALSYINNPDAMPEDVALYLGFSDRKLVAFRSIFAGSACSGNQLFRFGWCSGNWVHAEYRRKGLSQKLLAEAYADWNGKLMFTNYAPESEKLYIKTGLFNQVHQFDGVRAYLFFRTASHFSSAGKGFVLVAMSGIIDMAADIAAGFTTLVFRRKKSADLKFEVINAPDDECYRYLESEGSNHFFKRGRKELEWIFHYPWISPDNEKLKGRYPFSSFIADFYYRVVKVYRDDRFQGFFIFSIRSRKLKTLYFLMNSNMEKDVAGFLRNYCVNNKIETATIYNSAVAHQLFNRKLPFLHVKKYGQKIYSSFTVPDCRGLVFQDGDGDVFFT